MSAEQRQRSQWHHKLEPRRARTPWKKKKAGFTLIELLVVMTIIGMLAAMVYPAAMAIMRHVRKVQATNAATELRRSIATYSVEYRRYPVRVDGKIEKDFEIDSDAPLMDVLLAADRETVPGGLNPRKRVFFAGKPVRDEERPRHGILYESGGGGSLHDPWGNLFTVVIDTNRDERCVNPSDPSKTIAQEVLVWSWGEDGVDDRGEGDDVTLW